MFVYFGRQEGKNNSEVEISSLKVMIFRNKWGRETIVN